MSTEHHGKESIVSAGFLCFAENGYKHTSVEDVAKAAGVSKALVFHHFKSKRQLYEELMDYALSQIGLHFADSDWQQEKDFFKRQVLVTKHKLSVIKLFPHIYDFICRAYKDKEDAFTRRNLAYSDIDEFGKIFEGVDTSKFKPEYPLSKILQMLQWFSKGFTDSLDLSRENLDSVVKELEEYMAVLKKTFYLEEYLHD